MKLFTIFSFLVLFIGSSCGVLKSGNTLNNKNSLDSGKVERRFYNADRSDSGYVSIDYSFYTTSGISYMDTVNDIIKTNIQLFTSFEKSVDTGKLNLEYIETKVNNFISMYEEENDPELGSPWDLEAIISIDESRNNYVLVNVSAWSYTGGAHGNGSTIYYKIDKLTGRQLTKSDFITDIPAFNKIAEEYFRKQLELSSEANLEEEGFWFENNNFNINSNFYFSEDSIIFLYNPYEITSYAAGAIELEIPLKEINHLLKR